jgi:hypothetical protein
LYQVTVNAPSSPDSSDSSTGSPEISFDANFDLESSLPGVVSHKSLFNLIDYLSLKFDLI